MRCFIVLPFLLLLTGCASSGVVIGPFSHWADESNRSAKLERNVVNSQTINRVQKGQILVARSLGAGEKDIAVGLGIDFTELLSGDHTWGERFKMLGADLADVGLWTGLVTAGIKAYEALKHDNAPASVVKDLPTTANGGTVTVIYINNNSTLNYEYVNENETTK